jgi:tetratricopeptide (TPR) repeat protein
MFARSRRARPEIRCDPVALSSTSSDEIFELVLSDPRGAVELLDRRLDDPVSTGIERARHRWARGTALRDLGRLDEAEHDLRQAMDDAGALGDRHLVGRIAVTASLVAFYKGDASDALRLLDDAASEVDDAERGHVSMQRALIHHRMGRLDEAQAGYRRALQEFESAGDELGVARACVNLGVLCAHLGALADGVDLLERARRSGQAYVAAVATQNLGYLRARAGDVPAALDALAEAESRFAALGNNHQVALTLADRATVLMQVGLSGDAQQDADTALRELERGGHRADIADVALLAAQARLANGSPVTARAAADQAAAAYREQRRDALLVLSRFVQLQAELADEPGADLLGRADRADQLSRSLISAGWTNEGVLAALLAGRCLLDAGAVKRARDVLFDRRLRTAGRPAHERIALHLARALAHEAGGDRVRSRRSVAAGLATFAENQASLGALDLRAHVTGLADELATLGARLAVADRRPRELLRRIEAARGAVSQLPRVRPPADDELAALTARLRLVVGDIRSAIAEGRPATAAEQERRSLERRIADRARRRRADLASHPIGVTDAIDALGDAVLVEYGDLDGRLVAVSVVGGRAAMHELGAIADLRDELDGLSFALHRCQRRQGSEASRRAALSALTEAGDRLGRALLPERVVRSGAALVVVPTGALHGLTWGALPVLLGRVVTVAPSLIAHAVATGTARRTGVGGVGLVAGPRLAASSAEIAALGHVHAGATVLDGAGSTVEGFLGLLGSASLVHLACHGTFRADNPLFSTLDMADGDVTVYDLERCSRLPSSMVLSACNAAQSAVLRGDALLGMSAALLQLGVASVVAPLTPVNDELSLDVMVRLHSHLAAGRAPAQALALATDVDGALDPTAAAFVCMGC